MGKQIDVTTTEKTQYTRQDPRSQYPQPELPEQERLAEPGLAQDMEPKPDHGEDTYRGSGRLTDAVAVVTGADSGIGRAVAIAYAREGADVVLSYLESEQADADDVVALVEQAGRTALAVPGDLSTREGCRELIQKTVDQFGRVDVLVSNAGKQMWVDDITDVSDEQFDETLKTNVYAFFWLVKDAVPHMQPGAAIIASSSVVAYQPPPGLVDYGATKAAMNNMTKSLGQQLAPKGIRVNAVAPGPVWTPLQSSGGQKIENLPTFGQGTPTGRPGQPAELAGAYVYLASQESSFTVGETLAVTGGLPTP